MPKINFTKRLLSIFLLAFFLSANSTLAFNPDLLANAINSTGNSLTNIYQSYIISPLSDLLISIFNLSDTPVEVSTTPQTTKLPTATTTTENTVTTLPPNSGLQIRGATSLPASGGGPKGDKGDKGDTGPRGPAGSSANIDTSNFVDSAFFDKQVNGILGSIESGVSGLSSALAEEVDTVLLNVSGLSTLSGGAVIGSSITGTDKALVVNNNTSTGNIAEFQDNGTAVVTIADGGNVGVGTSTPVTQLHVYGKVPTAPIATASPGTNTLGLFVQDHYAYTGGYGGQQFGVWDISNPAAPTLVGALAIHSVLGIYVQGRYAYVVHDTTLDIVDVSNPTAPTLVGTVSATGSAGAGGIYVQGRYAYVTDTTNSVVRIFDVSKPTAPVQVATASTPAGLARLYVQGRYLYAQAGSYLKIFDVQNPLVPVEVGSQTTTGKSFQGIYVQGRYAYLTDLANNTLDIFDVSNPAAPASIATISSGGTGPLDVYVQGHIAYVINNSGTLNMFDVSVPTVPVSLGSVTSPNSSYRVHVQGRYAYAIGEGSNPRFQVYDVGGAYVQQLETGGIETGTLTLRNNLQVGNDAEISGGLFVARGVDISGPLSATGNLSITQTAAATGALKGIVYTGAVNTNQTLSTEIPSLTLTTAGRQWATGALTTQREVLITAPTYSFVGASTITNAATVGIAGAPIASTNATLTNSHGLLIQAGAVTGGVVTNSYGLTVNAQTGATNNYAAQFMGGNVGIGTATPTSNLEVVDTDSDSFALNLNRASSSATHAVGEQFSLLNSSSAKKDYAVIYGGITTNTAGSEDGFLEFHTLKTGTLTNQMRIASTGNVGIGTLVSTPLVKLHVTGPGSVGYPTLGTTYGSLFLSSDNNLYGLFAGVNTTDGNSWMQAMRKDSATAYNLILQPVGGSVGIGTTAPVGQFQVHTTTTDNILKVTNATTGSALGDGFMIQQQGLNAYLWNFEAGALQLATSNASRINIDSLGAVTIGNNNLGASSKALVVNNGATSTGNIFEAQDGGTAVFTIADGGAVSVVSATPLITTGTTDGSDSKYLEINGGGATGNTRGGRIQISGNERGGGSGGSIEFITGNVTTGDLIFYTGSDTERARISNASSSAATLRLYTKDDSVGPAISLRQSNETTSGFDFDQDSLVNGDLSLYRVTTGTRTHVLSVQRTDGNVGIGTTSPGAKLEVKGSNTGTVMIGEWGGGPNYAGIGLQGSLSSTDFTMIASPSGDNSVYFNRKSGGNIEFQEAHGTSQMVIKTGGDVGIGDTTPDALLDVKGTVCLDINQDEACTDNTSTLSDSRLKDNVVDINNGLELVRQFRPVTFTWNGVHNTGTANSFGFLAQDMEALFPGRDIVITDSEGYKNLDYGKLTAVLADAIQELDINLNAISGTVTLEPGSASETFVTAFFDNIFTKVGEWLASATNGITNIFANTFNAKESICVDGECLNKEDVRALLLLAHPEGTPAPAPAPTPEPDPIPDPTPADPTCSDGIQNQDETGVDTGGVCTPAPVPEPTPEPAPEIVP